MIVGAQSLYVAAALVLLGLSVLYMRRLEQLAPAQPAEDNLQQALEIVGWNCLLVGGFFLSFALGWLGMLAIASIVGAALVGAARYRTVHQAALLGLLAALVQRRAPVSAFCRSMAREIRGGQGRRMLRLAADLDAGIPLSDSLRRWRVVPRAATAAVRATPLDVAGGLQAAIPSTFAARALERAAVFTAYALWIVYTAAATCIFFVWKIMPHITMIVAGFQAEELAAPLINKLWAAPFAMESELLLFGLFSPLVLLLGCWTILWLLGHVPWAPPILGRFFYWRHRALALRCLAAAVRGRQPLETTLSELSRAHPAWHFRRRLRRVTKLLALGTAWQQALVKGRLVRSREGELLLAAQQAGNLDWALQELAAGNERRAAYRLEMALHALLPLLVGTVALVAAVLGITVFWPLVKIAESIISWK